LSDKHNFSEIAHNTIKRLLPENLLKERVRQKNGVLEYKGTPFFNSGDFNNIFVVSIGKAAVSMLDYFSSIIDIDYSIAVNPYYENSKKNIFKSCHPFMDHRAFDCAEKILRFLKKADFNDVVIFLISGGSSALIEKPLNGVSRKDIIKVNSVLLEQNIDIVSVNNIRQSLSMLKGGGLLDNTRSSTISFILSDISGGFFEYTGSGPTVWQKKDKDFYCNVLNKVKKIKDIPSEITLFLKNKCETADYKSRGKESLFVKLFQPSDALNVFCNELYKAGFKVKHKIVDFNDNIDVLIEKILCERDNLNSRDVIAVNGEVLYSVAKGGLGGRVQEFCLRMSKFLQKGEMCGGIATDGVDGVTEIPVKGAYICGDDIDGVCNDEISYYINSSNSNLFLKKYGFLLNGGYTGTNLCDLYFFIKS
jgi:glycerate-2-kinase